MLRYFFLGPLLFALLTSCQPRNYEQVFGDLNQPVLSVTETYYPALVDSLGQVNLLESESQPFSGVNITYNAKGWVVEKTYFGADREVDATYTRSYDAQGRVLEERFKAAEDSTAWVSHLEQMMGDQLLYKEYEEAHPAEEVFVTLLYHGDTISRWINNIVASKEVLNEHLLPLQKFTYAENGDDYSEENFTYQGKVLLKHKYEGPQERDDYTYTYTYDAYDEQGNWTQRLAYRNGRPERFTIRTITYR